MKPFPHENSVLLRMWVGPKHFFFFYLFVCVGVHRSTRAEECYNFFKAYLQDCNLCLETFKNENNPSVQTLPDRQGTERKIK